jgi:pSer/pThr/pTyr-binding forkhead associated (FHA) protein
MKCKVCPVCNKKSALEELICWSCLTPLDNVEAKECDDAEHANVLYLVYETNELQIENGDILGREAKGDSFLADKLTVSRKHAKLTQKDNQWFVTDLGSTNGTYLNGKRIESHKEVALHDNDTLGLSRKVDFRVKL